MTPNLLGEPRFSEAKAEKGAKKVDIENTTIKQNDENNIFSKFISAPFTNFDYYDKRNDENYTKRKPSDIVKINRFMKRRPNANGIHD